MGSAGSELQHLLSRTQEMGIDKSATQLERSLRLYKFDEHAVLNSFF